MNINEAKNILERAIDLKLPIMLWGPPGIGKSALVAAIAKERKLDLIDLRLAQLDATDLRGIPVPDKKLQRVAWYPPLFLPQIGKGILFLDEIDKASTLVKNAALQLVLDRRLGDYVLPVDWVIVCAGNRDEDMAFSSPLGSALANRMIHLDIEPNLDIWSEWAKANGVPVEIIGFLNFRSEFLYKQTGTRAFPSPRSWAMAGKLLKAHEDGERLLGVAVGPTIASEFSAWIKLYRNLKVEDILDGKLPDLSQDNASLRYAVALAVASYITRNGIKKPQVRHLGAVIEALTPELRVLLLKGLPIELLVKLTVHPEIRKIASKVVWNYVGQVPLPHPHPTGV